MEVHGPVHINIPTNTYNRTFNAPNLPNSTKIERISVLEDKKLKEMVARLEKANRILVTCGQKSNVSDELKKSIKEFFKKFNATVVVDYMSNIDFEDGINTTICMDSRYVNNKTVKELLPDIVISYGGNIFSGIKEQLRKFNGQFEHWSIQEDGHVVDLYKSLTTIFECDPEFFFNYFVENASTDSKNNMEYYNMYKKYVETIVYPEFDYSHVYAIKNVVEKIPSNSILHLSINDSIRITNFFKLNPNIKVYANIGTHGIDGCMSSFFGQVAASKKTSYLIIGDLAFFYDMNSLKLNDIGKNVHILLINNHGGSEFYFNGIWQNNDKHTTARHNTKAEGWVKSNDYIYISANDKKSFDENLEKFMSEENDKPIVFEVFTEMKTDADVIHNFFELSRPHDVGTEIMRVGKEFVKKSFGQERAKQIIGLLKK